MSACALAVFSSVSLLAGRVRARLIAALALYLARPLKRCSQTAAADTESADPEALSAMLRCGDVVLTEGNTRMAALVRRITGSPWSHVSMYVGPLEEGPDPRCIVEADVAAGVRAVPLSELKGLRLRVLRPTCLRDIDRRRLADWVVNRIGDEYDVAHAWALARRLVGLPSARRLPPAGSIAQGATRFICSSLLAQAFVLVGYPIAAVQLGDRDSRGADHRYVTPRDFESAPVFEVIHVGPADRRR